MKSSDPVLPFNTQKDWVSHLLKVTILLVSGRDKTKKEMFCQQFIICFLHTTLPLVEFFQGLQLCCKIVLRLLP